MAEPEKPRPFTQEELNLSSSAEQQALQDAQMEHLKNRVVVLRANLDRKVAENLALIEEIASLKAEKKRPAKKAAAKKATPRRAAGTDKE